MQIVIERNSCCSKWIDVIEMIEAEDIGVVDQEGESITGEFMQAYKQFKKDSENKPVGICVRWAIGVKGPAKDLMLIMQALPCSIGHIRDNQHLQEDEASAIVVASFKLASDR